MEKSFMMEALKEAEIALSQGEVPVGAVIVKDNKIISKAHNLRERLNDPTAHAEVIAIREAASLLNNWRLSGCSIYVTLEPCPMCAGAILQSRISRVYIGTFDPTLGACGSVVNLLQNELTNSYTNVYWLYNEQCSNILKDFFKMRRKSKC